MRRNPFFPVSPPYSTKVRIAEPLLLPSRISTLGRLVSMAVVNDDLAEAEVLTANNLLERFLSYTAGPSFDKELM